MKLTRRRTLTALALSSAGVLQPGWAQPTPSQLLQPSPQPLQRQTLRVSDGVALSVLRTAASSAAQETTVLFVPGWGMPASLFTDNLLALASLAPQTTCVAYDPRGQGESDAPAHGYTLKRRTADLHEVLAPYQGVVLVAWSLGVLEALHYVHTYGHEKLAALVLVDNSVGEPPAPKPGDFLQRLRADRAATVERFVRGLFATPQPEARIEEIKRSALKTTLEQSIALLSYPMPREHWRRVARAFPKPLAYLVTPRFATQAHNLKAARPATRIEIFKNAGHALFVDEAARFNAVVAGVLRDAGP